MDSVSISGHLGHATPTTTQNLYAHVIAESESRIAAALGEVIISSRKKLVYKDGDSQSDMHNEKTG